MATVLVVDEHAANREAIVSLLRSNGHRTLEAGDSGQALSLVRAEKPEVVLSDILAPMLDGCDLARSLHADRELSGIRIIFFAARHHEREAWTLAKSCHVTRVLLRPCSDADTVAMVERALHDEPEPQAIPAQAAGGDNLRTVTEALSRSVQDLQIANQRLSALTAVNLQLSSQRDPHVLLDEVCAGARALVGARYVLLSVRATSGTGAPYFTASGAAPGERIEVPPMDTSFLWEVVAGRRALHLVGDDFDPRMLGFPPGSSAGNSVLAAPVVSLSEEYGWICAVGKVGAEAFSSHDEEVLAVLGAQVGRIYENGNLYAEAQRTTALLEHEAAERRHATKELSESELRFRQIAENIREVFFLITADNLRTLYVSPAYEEVWGRTRQSLYDDPSAWMAAIHPDDRVKADDRGVNAAFNVSYRIIRPDGSLRWIQARGFPIHDENGHVYRIAGLAEDVTAWVGMENVLREQAAGLRRAQIVAKLAHLVAHEDGSVESWSETLPALLGVDEEDVPQTVDAWLELVEVGDREAVRAMSEEVRSETTRGEAEYSLQRRDGTRTDIRHIIEPVPGTTLEGELRWFSTFQDITETNNAARVLRESERRFSCMLDNVELVAIMLDVNGRVLYCNDYLLRLSGWGRAQVVGKDWFELFIPPERSDLRASFPELLADSPRMWHHRNEIVTRDGQRRLLQWNNSVLRSASGVVVGTASIGEDVTERERAQAEVQHLNASLEVRVRERTAELQAANEDLEAFDYSVAHDLRGPLRLIDGFSALLLEDHGQALGSEGRENVEQISRAGRQLSRLLADLLTLSTAARGAMQRQPVDVGAVANKVLDALQKTQPERHVEVVVGSGLIGSADPGLLRIVLDNLLGNAWKFTSRRDDARIEVGRIAGMGDCGFFVADNGAGFDMAHARKLFGPFQRLHAQSDFPGTGIGLATVRRILRRHGGRVWAESEPAQGATFFFTLEPQQSPQDRPEPPASRRVIAALDSHPGQ